MNQTVLLLLSSNRVGERGHIKIDAIVSPCALLELNVECGNSL
jgi:hypothetical protein